MVESWALNQKRWKKWFAWNLYQRSDLKKSALIHATSKEEQESIERLRLGVKTVFIPNGVCLPDFEEISPKGVVNPNEIKQALFLSRIHPKKGLPLLVEAWKEVRPEGWEMLVVGPDDGGHLGEVKKMVQNAGLSSNWRFLDSVEGIEKWRLLNQVDIFILPTYSENFGNVVAEALIAGVPVLTTTGAPWRELAKHGFGWCVAPNVKEIAIALREATSLTRNSLKQKGQAGRVWAKERFSIEATARSMLDAYQSVNEQKRIAKSK
jgi:glycosyltransferase involved in cell wall biosynthesis